MLTVTQAIVVKAYKISRGVLEFIYLHVEQVTLKIILNNVTIFV